MGESVERIRYVIGADGAEKTAAQFATLSKSQAVANDNFRAMNTTASKAAITLGTFGTAAGRLDPTIGALGASVTRASGTISAMSTLVSGPWALAIGAGVTALGFFAEAQRKAKEDADELKKSLEEQKVTFQGLVETYAAAGKGLFDFNAEGASLDAQIRAAEAMAKRTTGSRGRFFADNAARLRERRDALQLSSQTKESETDFESSIRAAAAAGDPAAISYLKSLNKKDGKTALERGEAENELLMFQAGVRMQSRGRAGSLEFSGGDLSSFVPNATDNDDRITEFFSRHRPRFDDNSEGQKALQGKVGNELAASMDAATRPTDELAASLKAAEQNALALKDAGLQVSEIFGGQMIGAFQALAKGQKVSGAAILESIGDELVAFGTVQTFKGLARVVSSYGTDPSGYTLMGIGAGAITSGIAMGAAGAYGAPSEGGAGGGGGSQRNATPIGLSRETGMREDRPISVTVQTLIANEEAGEVMVRSIEKAQRAGRV